MNSLREASVAHSCAKSAAWLLAACIPTAIIIILVPKLFVLVRCAWAAIVLGIWKRFAEAIFDMGPSFGYAPACQIFGLLVFLQCCNFLITTRLDTRDLVNGTLFTRSDGFALKVLRTVRLMFNLRGIGTSWQISRVNGFPNFYKKGRRENSRGRYLGRQLLIISWEYVFLDVMYAASLNNPPSANLFSQGKEFTYRNANWRDWQGRIMSSVMFWLVMARTSIDILSRTTAFISVLMGISSPKDWPPVLGSFLDAYTLRRFWSHYWHQYFRWPLTSISNFICRDIMRLPRPSLFERYLNISFVFLASGIIHIVSNEYARPHVSGRASTLAFFGSFSIGILLEDGVQELYRLITGLGNRNTRVRLWHQAIGYAWVFFWFITFSPWFLYPQARTSLEGKCFLPVNIVDLVGDTVLWTFIIAGGLILKFAVGGEI